MGIRLKGFAAALVAVAVGVSGAAVSVPSDAVAAGKAKVGVLVSTSVKTVKPSVKKAQLGLPASGTRVTLDPGKTYKTNLVGTKKHKIKYNETVSQSGNTLLMLWVDGKYALDYKAPHYPHNGFGRNYFVTLVKVNKQRTLLFVHHVGALNSGFNTLIYKYVSGKFSAVSNLAALSNMPSIVQANAVHAGNNKFTVSWHVANMPAIGGHDASIEYSFSDSTGKVKQISDEYALRLDQTGGYVNNVGTLTRSMTAYKAPGNSGGVAFKAGKGKKVKVLKVKNTKGKGIFVKVQYAKKVGWININTPGYERLFKEARFY